MLFDSRYSYQKNKKTSFCLDRMNEGIRQYSVEKGTEEIIYKANRLNMKGNNRLVLLLAARAKEMHLLLESKFGTICSILFSKGTWKFYYPAKNGILSDCANLLKLPLEWCLR